MSAIIRCKSKMTSQKFLLLALAKLHVLSEHITSTDKGVMVSRDYHKGMMGVRYYKFGDSKVYESSYDVDDTRKLNAKAEGKTFTGDVAQWYNALIVKDTLKKQGFMPTVKRVGGKLRVYAQA
jgi:hypothetical protein